MLSVESTGPVIWLTLQRPEKCNALSVELNQALIDACREVSADCAVVVLQGAGRHFCAGSDLLDLYRADRAEAERVLRLEIAACHALASLPQMTVAILHGKCRGGGAILPLYCDWLIGRAGVDFALPEVNLGWAPPYGIERLQARVGRGLAAEALLSGRGFRAEEALRCGWIDVLCGEDPEEAKALVAQIAQGEPRVVRDTVGLLPIKLSEAARDCDERSLRVFLDHFDTEHARRRIAGFVEGKRN